MAVIADTSLIYDGQDVFEDGWRLIFNATTASGVHYTDGNDLAPFGDGSGRTVKVRPGVVVVEGQIGIFTGGGSPIPLPVAANTSSQPRISLVVARNRYGSPGPPATPGRMELDVIDGTPGGPAPTLTNNSVMQEIQLATLILVPGYTTILAGDVQDNRFYTNVDVLHEEIINDTAAVNITTTAALIDSGVVHLPSGWNQMSVSVYGFCEVHDVSSSSGGKRAAMSVRVGAAVIGHTQHLSFPDVTPKHYESLIVGHPIGSAITSDTTVQIYGAVEVGATNDLQLLNRYVWAIKTRRG